MADFDHSFQKLVAEAVAACGPDRMAIERYVLQKREAVDEGERERLQRDIDLVLNFHAPGFREDREN